MDNDALAFEQRKGERLLAEAEHTRFVTALTAEDDALNAWHEERMAEEAEFIPDTDDYFGEWQDPYAGPEWPGEGLDSV